MPVITDPRRLLGPAPAATQIDHCPKGLLIGVTMYSSGYRFVSQMARQETAWVSPADLAYALSGEAVINPFAVIHPFQTPETPIRIQKYQQGVAVQLDHCPKTKWWGATRLDCEWWDNGLEVRFEQGGRMGSRLPISQAPGFSTRWEMVWERVSAQKINWIDFIIVGDFFLWSGLMMAGYWRWLPLPDLKSLFLVEAWLGLLSLGFFCLGRLDRRADFLKISMVLFLVVGVLWFVTT